MLILNSFNAANELLDKRSKLYSSRPHLTMLSDLMGWGFAMGFAPYSDRWRPSRRYFHQYFNENAVKNFRTVQERSAHAFCQNLLDTPGKLRAHVRLLIAESILEAVYGIEVQGHDDYFLKVVEKVMAALAVAATPGRFLVGIVPFLKHIPWWFPGAGFQKFAQEARPLISALRDVPADHVRKQIIRQHSSLRPTCWIFVLGKRDRETLKDPGLPHNSRNEGKIEYAGRNSGAAAYAAGADTTNSAALTFFLLMANYPHCQKAAQDELDSVLGRGRLPTFEDREDLPYVNALVKEILRYHVVVPLGLPHALIQDDEYNGCFIPKGNLIYGNIWAILHDSRLFSHPHVFNPDRWLIDTPEGKRITTTLPNPDITFGFGRRICPGRHFADNSLFITVASVLTCFNIALLNDGEYINERFTGGTLVFPLDFQVTIKPRSDEVLGLINDTAVHWVLSNE